MSIMQQSATESPAPSAAVVESERVVLLQQENKVLTQHNASLELEISRVRQELAASETRAVEAMEEAASSAASLRSKEAEAAELARACVPCQSSRIVADTYATCASDCHRPVSSEYM
jgi:septal ring factor EnvC (AmiA/AmiB activator)